MTGKPLYVAEFCKVLVPVAVLVRIVVPPINVCTGGVMLAGKKFSETQPFWKVVVNVDLFADNRTLVLLNVITFASQQIESVPVGGGGENPGTFDDGLLFAVVLCQQDVVARAGRAEVALEQLE